MNEIEVVVDIKEGIDKLLLKLTESLNSYETLVAEYENRYLLE
jgi:hypothetical protein